ncbi:calcium-transporting P [Stemphylium lycopersici]|uniref:P-type Ca(2+) transporter n=1 Tax=Stemphylium lycopersici TaxID=183478 RepID=A0A364MVV4_STELY|nr:calcium-transporting P [Stemphylium lycopersici]
MHLQVSPADVLFISTHSCSCREDTSNYWTASIYFQSPENGTFRKVPQMANGRLNGTLLEQDGGLTVYYMRPFSGTNKKTTAMKPGFRMLAGDPNNRSQNGTYPGICHRCLEESERVMGGDGAPCSINDTASLPSTPCPGGIRATVIFPSCWDGVTLDSPNHRSHVAHAPNLSGGLAGDECPSTHPVRIPQVMYEVMFDTSGFADAMYYQDGKQPFVYSFGDPPRWTAAQQSSPGHANMSKASTPSLPLYNASSAPSKSSRPSSPMLQPPEPHKRSATPSSITATHSLLSAQDTAQRHSTSVTHGLSASDASARIHVHGLNELPHEEPEPLWLRFIKQFKETLILLLLGSAGVSFIMGNLEDAVSITVAVTIVVTVGFVQEYRSEKSIEALNQLVPHSAHIIRAGVEPPRGSRMPNGTATEGIELENLKDTAASLSAAERKSTTISATLLVPGDLVLFHTGDRIPADIRITHAADLSIDESNLTGENEPVSKSPDTIAPPSGTQRPSSPFYASEAAGTVGADIRLNDQKNIAFMGTLVRSGYGQGIVIGTGGNTEFGAISASLQQIESPRTPLQLSMDRLGKDLSYMSFGVIAFIGLVGLWRGWEFLEVFQIAVSLAVAAIPEGLPIIVTVTLALGVLRMSKRDAIVRRLPSVETLASVNVVCTDKTGTLTTNHMTVTKIWHFGEAAPTDVKEKHQSTDLDSPTRNILRIGNIVNNARLLSDQAASASTAAVLSSTLGDDNASAKSRWVGQPTDVALLDLMDAFGEDDVRERLGDRKFETPFSSERKWMGVVVGGTSGSHTPGSEYAYVKGALEKVLDRCDTYVTAQGKEVPLDQARKQEAMKAADSMAQEGLRVLGFASGASKAKKRNASGTASPAPSTNSALGDDDQYRGLVFAGLVGMNDPPRKGVERAIRRLMAGKVKVIMITGDAETTAVAIGKSLGMPITPNSAIGRSVIRGDEVDQMSEEELAQAIATTSIFARTSPDHKMKIVRALQSRGDVVAMTGDGVNDAPALKKADIGISMGRLGTDVAKEAADMILTDDNFATILNAIEEGKGIFYNIQNFLTFQLSTSAAALSLVLLSTFLGFQNPLNAMQILWINILMDGPPAQSLGVEPVDPAVMALPPRPRQARVLTRPLIQRVLQSATIIMLGTLTTYYLEMSDGNVVSARDTTMTFTCFQVRPGW